MSFIEDFLSYTSALSSPAIFRLWAGISAVAGAMERRVHTAILTQEDPIYANLYIMLVASPGIGKSMIINPIRKLWGELDDPLVGKIKIAPDGVTKAALLDKIEKSKKMLNFMNGTPVNMEFSSLNVASREFGTLVPSHDLEFLNVMTDLYDCPSSYLDETRTSKSVAIHKPQINMIVGVTPGYLASLLPEEAWTQGFMSRMSMIYSATSPELELFSERTNNAELYSRLQSQLSRILGLHGHIPWTQSAKLAFVKWYKGKMKPIPEHSKLQHYTSRRMITTAKLSMIFAVANGEAEITEDSFILARNTLLDAEIHMPDVFREMIQRSDSQVIGELHLFMWKIWVKDKKPIHETMIVHFLTQRLPHEKIIRLMEIAMRAGIIAIAGDKLWIPRPREQHGLE